MFVNVGSIFNILVTDSEMDLIILQESDNEDEVSINEVSQVVTEVTNPPTNLPPKAPIVKPQLKVGEFIFSWTQHLLCYSSKTILFH